jgi:dTDP-4-amino-4,6-dideoxygalactose transaminase
MMMNLLVAIKIANEVICLPMYAGLENTDIKRIMNIISK